MAGAGEGFPNRLCAAANSASALRGSLTLPSPASNAGEGKSLAHRPLVFRCKAVETVDDIAVLYTERGGEHAAERRHRALALSRASRGPASAAPWSQAPSASGTSTPASLLPARAAVQRAIPSKDEVADVYSGTFTEIQRLAAVD